MKKYIALLLCVLMIVSCFVGCGKKEEEADLVVWTDYDEGITPVDEAFLAAVAEFEELKGVNVEVKCLGANLSGTLTAALAAGERIDVFPIGSTIALNTNIDYTMDITDYIVNSDMLDRAYPIHMQLIKKQSASGEAYHAIPTESSFNSFWYNVAAFEAAGITEKPETIEEFEAVCQALVDAGYNPMALDSAYATLTFGALVERMVGEANVASMALEGGFAENEKFVEACQKVIDWEAAGFFDPYAPSEWPSSQNKIGLTEENAMVYCGAWLPGEVETMTGAQLEWDCFKFPYDPDGEGTYGATVSCKCHSINAKCENPDLAWDFLYFMNTGKVNKELTDMKNFLVDDMMEEALPRFAGAKELMASVTEEVNYAGGLHENTEIKTAINDVIINLFAGNYATGEEAAAAFDALVA